MKKLLLSLSLATVSNVIVAQERELRKAILSENSAEMAKLLDCGASPNSVVDQDTHLGVAVERGYRECVGILLAYHADVNAVPCSGSPSPLHRAVWEDSNDIDSWTTLCEKRIVTQLLAVDDICLDQADQYGHTPLFAACEQLQKSARERKVPINLDCANLDTACEKELKLVEELLHAGADFDKANLNGWTRSWVDKLCADGKITQK